MKEKKTEQTTPQVLEMSSVIDVKEWEEKQKKVLLENPYVEINDKDSYSEAKKARTNLVKARTSLSGQEKILVKKINEFKSHVKEETFKLIEITKSAEEKQQEEVKRWENHLEEEKEKEKKKEEERKNRIYQKLEVFKNSLNTCIESIDIDNHEQQINEFDKIIEIGENYEYEEFFIDFDETVTEKRIELKEKIKQVIEDEENRKKILKANVFGQKLEQEHGFKFSSETKTYSKGVHNISYDSLMLLSEGQYLTRVEEINQDLKAKEELAKKNLEMQKKQEEERKILAQQNEMIAYLSKEMKGIEELQVNDLSDTLLSSYSVAYDNACEEKFNLIKPQFIAIRNTLESQLNTKIDVLKALKVKEEEKDKELEKVYLKRLKQLNSLNYDKKLENNDVFGYGISISGNTIKYASEESFKNIIKDCEQAKAKHYNDLKEKEKVRAFVDDDKKSMIEFIDKMFDVLKNGVKTDLSEHTVKFFAGEVSELQKKIEEVRRNIDNL